MSEQSDNTEGTQQPDKTNLQINYQEWFKLINTVNNHITQITAQKKDIKLINSKLGFYKEQIDFLKEKIADLKEKLKTGE